MHKSHKIKLYPTKGQEVYFRKSCGTARFAYNWALATWSDMHEQGERTSAYTLIKKLNSIKRVDFPWMTDVTKNAPQYAIHNVEAAYKRFFKKQSQYPKFKKKGVKDSFVAVENKNEYKQINKKIRIPRLGWVRCAEPLRFNGQVNRVTVKRVADMWFAVIQVDVPDQLPMVNENQVAVGVDLGIKDMMILSDGTKIPNPKPLAYYLDKLKREQRRFSKKVKDSNNKRKQQIRIARLHYKVSCIRKRAIHDATRFLVSNYDRIVIEDLNVSGMVKNHKLARHLSDVSLGEIRRQLEYKCKWYGKELVVVDRWYPSSKLCSSCGYKNDELTLNVREWACPECGEIHDRDVNAAINLAKYSPTSETEGSNACGDGKIHDVSQVAVSEAGINFNL